MDVIAKNIKFVRRELKLKQQEFGGLLGTNQATVQSWEYGKAVPGAKFLEAIHRHFGVNLHWLLSGQGDPYIKKSGEQPVTAPVYDSSDYMSAKQLFPDNRMQSNDAMVQDMVLAAKVLGSNSLYSIALDLIIRTYASSVDELSKSNDKIKLMNSMTDKLSELEQKLDVLQKENASLRTKLADLETRTSPGETRDAATTAEPEKKAM
jgi:transcriptional regulator with XRE-family HTH domain